MSDLQTQQLLRLTALLQLERRVRRAARDEIAFVMVNETLTVLSYRQALLFDARGRILALSGVAAVDRNAPYVVFATRLWRHLREPGKAQIREVTAADVPADLRDAWPEWLPPHLTIVPLGPDMGDLLFAREQTLGPGDAAILDYVADAYGHAWRARMRRRGGSRRPARGWPLRTLAALLLAGAIGAALVPIRQSALAPAEIVPRDPSVIRAPLEGVIETIRVRPNEEVSERQVLFTLDPRRLQNQRDVSARALEAALAELRQARQSAVVDPKARATLPALQGKVDQQQAEMAYLTAQLERIEVRAPAAGLAVFDDPNDWLGRPVAIGERVMLVADPGRVQVEARLPVADALDLELGAPVRVFLNIDPEHARDAVLTYASYQPQKGPDGVYAYRIKAELAAGEIWPRIGLKGTAKLYGPQVPLAYVVLRRPISAARQWLGL